MIKRIFLILAVSGILMACWAGLLVNLETKNLKEKKSMQTMKMYISGKKINMDVFSEEHKGSTIFRGDKDLFWAIDHQKKEYTEITKEMMEQMGQSMGTAFKQMEEQMANMPPEQRVMMEQMMKGQMQMMSQATSEPTTLKKTGQKKKISGYSCTKYELYRGKEKVREMWMTGWKNIKNGKEALESFEAMSKFFKSLIEAYKDSPFAQMMDNPYSHANELNGFPVLTTEIDDGVATYETLFKDIQKKSISGDKFNPPKGYKVNKPDMKEE